MCTINGFHYLTLTIDFNRWNTGNAIFTRQPFLCIGIDIYQQEPSTVLDTQTLKYLPQLEAGTSVGCPVIYQYCSPG